MNATVKSRQGSPGGIHVLAEPLTGSQREHLTKLIEALRSGKYEQTTGRLARGGEDPEQGMSFCCLGVMCDIAKDEVDGRWVDAYGMQFYTISGVDTSYAPQALSSLFASDYILFSMMAIWNDSNDLNFNQIADLLDHVLQTGEIL